MYMNLTLGRPRHRQLSRRSAPYLLLSASLLFFTSIGISAAKTHFLLSAENATGTVTKNVARTKYNSKTRVRETSYYPVIQFKTSEGVLAKFEANFGGNPAHYGVGEKVEILFDPDRPTSAAINTFFAFWMLPLLFGGASFIMLGATVIVLRRRY